MFEWLKKIFRLRAKKESKNIRLVKNTKRNSKPKLKPKIKLKRKKNVEKKVLLVSDLMTRNIIPVYSTQSLEKVAKLFIEKNISGAPVLDKNLFVGEISKTDILQIAEKQELSQLTKEDFEKFKDLIETTVEKNGIESCYRSNNGYKFVF
jgi:predicted transcriptional regulator